MLARLGLPVSCWESSLGRAGVRPAGGGWVSCDPPLLGSTTIITMVSPDARSPPLCSAALGFLIRFFYRRQTLWIKFHLVVVVCSGLPSLLLSDGWVERAEPWISLVWLLFHYGHSAEPCPSSCIWLWNGKCRGVWGALFILGLPSDKSFQEATWTFLRQGLSLVSRGRLEHKTTRAQQEIQLILVILPERSSNRAPDNGIGNHCWEVKCINRSVLKLLCMEFSEVFCSFFLQRSLPNGSRIHPSRDSAETCSVALIAWSRYGACGWVWRRLQPWRCPLGWTSPLVKFGLHRSIVLEKTDSSSQGVSVGVCDARTPTFASRAHLLLNVKNQLVGSIWGHTDAFSRIPLRFLFLFLFSRIEQELIPKTKQKPCANKGPA